MWMKRSLATLRCRYGLSSSLKAVRMAAHSLAIVSRSSANVLHARTARISSLRISRPHTPPASSHGLAGGKRVQDARTAARAPARRPAGSQGSTQQLGRLGRVPTPRTAPHKRHPACATMACAAPAVRSALRGGGVRGGAAGRAITL